MGSDGALGKKPQQMHMLSIKSFKNGTVMHSSVVLERSFNINGRSGKTSGWVSTNGNEPAVVVWKPTS